MVEAERSLIMRPTSSSILLVDELPHDLSVDQLAELIKWSLDSKSKLLLVDCRTANDVYPLFPNALRIRISPMLLRRVQNGSLPLGKVYSQFDELHELVVMITDGSPDPLTRTISRTLEDKHVHFAKFRGDLAIEFAEKYPEFLLEGQENEAPSLANGLNFDLLNDGEQFECKPRHAVEFPALILQDVYLGNNATAKDQETLKKLNIHYVINVTQNLPNYFDNDPEMNYLRIPVDDNCHAYTLPDYFPIAIEFIDKARAENAAVLVHCLAGISRSVTVCLAYLIYDQRSTLDRAFDLLHKQNTSIAPNFQFMTELKHWEQEVLRTETETDSGNGTSQASSTCSSA
ncbi:Protein-tyrosine-phosphatase [Aphelenchoides besseyi]|nr:Protein-tyrosine-phosphatase [Aphelenchoides besseyi]KAI6236494.1 Protein-tyrosine-phosphatase [Aphelenchoides besseyi]